MTVEKFIRILGYTMYTALWSPVIVLALIILPFVWVYMSIQAGYSVKEGIILYVKCLKANIQHDMEFIRTGVWG